MKKPTAIDSFKKGLAEIGRLVSDEIIQPFKTTPFPNFEGVAVKLMMNDVPDHADARFELRKSGQTDKADELNDRMGKLISTHNDLFHALAKDDIATAWAVAETLTGQINAVLEIFGKNEKAQEKSCVSRKYPQDAEALALLEAAAKLKAKLAKGNPEITNKEVIQALLDEPDGNETNKQKDQRLKHQYRVWYGAIKNGKRKNVTAKPPERLDAKTRAATWEKHYKKWGKALSAYIIKPPAK